MRVRILQHVPFEGPGLIEPWLRDRGHEPAFTRWWANDPAPVPDDHDWLVVMGGPMNVYQDRDYPWLPAARAAVAASIKAGRRVLGICLGAQLIADALGARVVQNPCREIGWWPVVPVAVDPAAPEARFSLPAGAPVVLHWHGDTFTAPPGAVRLAASPACAWQAFAAGPRVLGLQFHLEMDASAVMAIATGCADELVSGGRWVQTADQIARGALEHTSTASALMEHLLGAMERD